jgi:DNA-binding transcriptional MerR regulator
MSDADELIDLRELAARTGVSVRTIRFYQQQGLLPAPGQRGPGALYGPAEVDRLRLLRMLQRDHLPLAEIRKQLQAMSDSDVSWALSLGKTPVQRSSAAEYARRVLEETTTPLADPPADQRSVAEEPSEVFDILPTNGRVTESEGPVPYGQMSFGFPRRASRESWDRITLSDDIELHVRRPLSREQQRLLEQLLATAQRHLEPEDRP